MDRAGRREDAEHPVTALADVGTAGPVALVAVLLMIAVFVVVLLVVVQ
jgi:hypothetical protein